ncbi:MAG: hypothetical protein OD811_03435 [Alphaproteobacteria bacterium]
MTLDSRQHHPHSIYGESRLAKMPSRRAGRVLALALTFAVAVATLAVALVVLWSLELPPPSAPVEIEIPNERLR